MSHTTSTTFVSWGGEFTRNVPIFPCKTSQEVHARNALQYPQMSIVLTRQMKYPTYFLRLRLFLLHAVRAVPASLGQTEERKPSSLPCCYISITHVSSYDISHFIDTRGGRSGLVMIRLLLPYPKKTNRAPKKYRKERIA